MHLRYFTVNNQGLFKARTFLELGKRRWRKKKKGAINTLPVFETLFNMSLANDLITQDRLISVKSGCF